MNKLSTLILTLGAALTVLSGCAITVNAPGSASSNRTTLKDGAVRLQCVASPTGECHYALYSTRCNSQVDGAGRSSTTCTYDEIEAFVLGTGSSRDLHDLPAGYKQCMRTDRKPAIPSCG